MKCRLCGNDIPEDNMFCTNCGAYVRSSDRLKAAQEKAEEKKAEEQKATEAVEEKKPEAEVKAPEAAEEKKPETEAKAPETPEKTAEPEKKKPEAAVFSSDEASDENKAKKTAPVKEELKNALEKTEQQDAPEAVEEKKPIKVGAGRIFGASLVSVLAIILLTVTGLLISAKIGLNGNVLRNCVEDANLGVILDADYDDEITAGQFFYNNIGSAILGRKNIAPQDLRLFLIEAEFENFAADKIKDYADYIIDGKKNDPSASSEDIAAFFKDNQNVADSVFEEPFYGDDYRNIAVRLENRGFDDALSVDEWSDTLGFKASNLSYIFSYLTMGIIAVAAIFTFVWIAIIVDRKGRHLTGFYGNITLISGIILTVPSAAFLLGAFPVAFATNALGAVLAAELLVPFALVMLCTGVFGIVVGVILKKIKKFIKKKEANK